MANADRNLLIGVVALQMDFINRDQMVAAMHTWIADKSRSLDQILLVQKTLGNDTHALLVALVDKHLEMHGGDAERSLASVSSLGTAKKDLQQLDDVDLEASLVHVAQNRGADDPYATFKGASVGEFTSKGQRFRVLRPHASGGLGTVSVANDEELTREVALKEIKEKYADDPTNRARFMVEAEITGGLEHPGIVPVYGLGQYADGRPFYAMRFIRGDSLKEAIEQFHKQDSEKQDAGRQSLELRKLLGRFVDVCYAMEYAHNRGVLHRDLKPGNIMLGKYGETLVVDWGLAKTSDASADVTILNEPRLRAASASGSTATQMGTHLGTPAYMSPEQAAGRLDLLKVTSDVYSLGATLYELLTGKVPVSAQELDELLRKVQRGDFPKPSAVRPGVPRPLEAICLRAMALEPADRYQSAAALADDIENWLGDEPVSAWREPLSVRVGRWLRKHKTFASSAAAAAIVALLILGFSVAMLKQKNAAIEAQRQRAEANLAVAKHAVDTMLTEVGHEKLADVPQFTQTRRELLTKAREFYEQLAKQQAGDAEVQLEAAIAWRRVADIDRIERDVRQAEKHYRSSIAQLHGLVAQHDGQAVYLQELALSLNNLGWLLQDHDPQTAIAGLNEAIGIQQALVNRSNSDAIWRQHLARSLYNRGIAFNHSGDQTRAIADYKAAITLLTESLESHRGEVNEQSRRQELARCHNNLAIALKLANENAGNDDPQIEFETAVQLAEELAAASPNNFGFREELAQYCNSLANLLQERKQHDEALRASSRALELWRDLITALPNLRNELANTLNTQAIILDKLSQNAAAEDSVLRAESMFRELLEGFPDEPQYEDRLGNALYTHATLKYYQGDFQAAKRLLVESLAHHVSTLERMPGNPQFLGHFGNDCLVLAMVLEELQQPEDAAAVRALSAATENMPELVWQAARLLADAVGESGNEDALTEAESESVRARLAELSASLLSAAVRKGQVTLPQISKETGEGGAFYRVKDRAEFSEIKALLEGADNSAPAK